MQHSEETGHEAFEVVERNPGHTRQVVGLRSLFNIRGAQRLFILDGLVAGATEVATQAHLCWTGFRVTQINRVPVERKCEILEKYGHVFNLT